MTGSGGQCDTRHWVINALKGKISFYLHLLIGASYRNLVK